MDRGDARIAVGQDSSTSFQNILGEKQVQRVIWNSRSQKPLYEIYPGDQVCVCMGEGGGGVKEDGSFTLRWPASLCSGIENYLGQGPRDTCSCIRMYGSQRILQSCLGSHPHDPHCYDHLLPPASGGPRPKPIAKHSWHWALAGDREINNRRPCS